MTTTKLAQHSAPGSAPVATKSKRVRTGCLTCRERHLKCDESLPNCMNCRKSNRACKRGVRLNFVVITVHNPSRSPPSGPWTIQFRDESRQIASEYRGGLSRYAELDKQVKKPEVEVEVVLRQQNLSFNDSFQASSPGEETHIASDGSTTVDYRKTATSTSSMIKSNPGSQPALDSHIRSIGWMKSTGHESNDFFYIPETFTCQNSFAWQDGTSQMDHSPVLKVEDNKPLFQPTPWPRIHEHATISKNHPAEEDNDSMKAATGEQEFLRTAEEVQYMQIYVEQVAIWMDCFDKEKHFSQSIPYRALKSPMLLNSLLACGARYLSLRYPEKNDTAQFYYNTATAQLLRNLENPERNTIECSAASVVLRLCEHMSRRITRHMSHVCGAPKLMAQDCGWDAGSTGIGSACFWLNVYLEVLNGLESDCLLSWHPNKWGLGIDWTNDGDENAGIGDEELWVQRIFYILAKAAMFRPFAPEFSDSDPDGEKMTPDYRLMEWKNLKQLCDQWNDTCPRTMHPLGYLYPQQIEPKSWFPRVWLLKREAVFGRLLYHTAQCIFTQTNPMEQTILSEEMSALQLHHAHEVCGIVGHSNDGGIGLIAIQSLTIAARVLVNQAEQVEVLQILSRLHARTGWPVEDVGDKLKLIWGWDTGPIHNNHHQHQQHHHEEQHHQHHNHHHHQQQQLLHTLGPDEHMREESHLAVLVTGAEQRMGQIPVPGGTEISMSHMDAPTERQASLNSASVGFGQPTPGYHGWYEPPSQAGSLSTPLYHH